MLCVYYQDLGERAQALISLARLCEEKNARLIFLGPAAAWDEICQRMYEMVAAPLGGLDYHPFEPADPAPETDRVWAEAIEILRGALLEIFATARPQVVWVELPAQRANNPTAARGFRAYCQALIRLPRGASGTVISAVAVSDLDEPVPQELIQSATMLVNARSLLPRCPLWLLAQLSPDPQWLHDAQQQAEYAALAQVPGCESKNLATLEQFVAILTHELGNPLSIISSSLQYLQQRFISAKDPASDFTVTALQSVEHIQELLTSMLDLAVVRKPRRIQVDFSEAISEILRFISAECGRRSIEVEVTADPFLPQAWVEPCGLKQMLLNLVKNALDAMTDSGDTLRIRTRRAAENDVVIEIENNGPAIPEEMLRCLFRPFHTTKARGTGLGLFVSWYIVKDHGGEIMAENLEQGVRFTVSLPVDRRKKEGSHGPAADR